MKNLTTFTGNITKDIELKQSQKGNPYIYFNIAVNDGWGDNAKAYFPRFKAFGDVAERIAKLFGKGKAISVAAKYTEEKYEDKEYPTPVFLVELFEYPPFGNKREESDSDNKPSTPSSSPKKNSPAKTAKPAEVEENDDDDEIPF